MVGLRYGVFLKSSLLQKHVLDGDKNKEGKEAVGRFVSREDGMEDARLNFGDDDVRRSSPRA